MKAKHKALVMLKDVDLIIYGCSDVLNLHEHIDHGFAIIEDWGRNFRL